MQHELPLDQLLPHPDNANAMPDAAFGKLKQHIQTSGRYPPLIVRPYGQVYQLLDGHHRAKALQELGHVTARCEVWNVDDAEALLLLATLNRLEGRDDPRKRAALLGQLRQSMDVKRLASLLPEDAAKLGRLLELNRPAPAPATPTPLDAMPVAVHFFLPPEQKRRLDQCLALAGRQPGSGTDDPRGRR